MKTTLDDKLTYSDLYEAALENSYGAETTLQEIRVLEHLKALASTKHVTKLINDFEAKKARGEFK